ncbi:MAG: hypothetical protein HFG05_12355 [Oscillibacter sp.]|nr:hypothetical protein [Oscillibacter sp.]
MIDIKRVESLEKGLRAVFVKTVGEADVVFFSGMTGNLDLSMVNEDFCMKNAFGSRIINPSLLLGLMLTAAQKVTGPGYVCQSQNADFSAPVHLGETITGEAEIQGIDSKKGVVTFATRCVNETDQVVAKGEIALSYYLGEGD